MTVKVQCGELYRSIMKNQHLGDVLEEEEEDSCFKLVFTVKGAEALLPHPSIRIPGSQTSPDKTAANLPAPTRPSHSVATHRPGSHRHAGTPSQTSAATKPDQPGGGTDEATALPQSSPAAQDPAMLWQLSDKHGNGRDGPQQQAAAPTVPHEPSEDEHGVVGEEDPQLEQTAMPPSLPEGRQPKVCRLEILSIAPDIARVCRNHALAAS